MKYITQTSTKTLPQRTVASTRTDSGLTTTLTFGDLYSYIDRHIQNKTSPGRHQLIRGFSDIHGIRATVLIAILKGFGGYDDMAVLLHMWEHFPQHTLIHSPLEEVFYEQPMSPCLYNALVNYATAVARHRWDPAERILLAPSTDTKPIDPVDRAYGVCLYSSEVVKGRWQEGEEFLLACTYSMLQYANKVIKGKLPAALHNAMVMKSFEDTDDQYVKEYINRYGV